VKAERRELSKK